MFGMKQWDGGEDEDKPSWEYLGLIRNPLLECKIPFYFFLVNI
jgi:hypothetical protein